MLYGGVWSALFSSHSSPGKNPSTHWVTGWADLRAGMDILEKRELYLCVNMSLFNNNVLEEH